MKDEGQNMREIELSVGLPIYKMREIVWLALEGLCNQTGVNFKWELLIAEEKEECFGHERIKEYQSRLESVGCVRIDYLSFEDWMPLSGKWKILIGEMSKSSKGFVLQAADNYSPCDRLSIVEKNFRSGYDWIQYRRSFFYDILDKRLRMYHNKGEHPCGPYKSIASRLLKKITLPGKKTRCVDGWLYSQVEPEKVLWINNHSFTSGLCTNGFKHLSKNRRDMMSNNNRNYYKTEVRIKDILPSDVRKRLDKLSIKLKKLEEEQAKKEQKKRAEAQKEMGEQTDDPYPNVTIGIVVSRPELLERAVSNINKNSYQGNVECILHDNTKEQAPVGQCYNELVKKCEDEWIGFIGDDDYVKDGYIAALMAVRREAKRYDGGCVGMVSHLTLIDEQQFRQVRATSPGIWSKEFLEKESFNEELPKHITAEHMERVSEKGYNIALAGWFYGYMYVQHDGNMSGNKFKKME